MLLDENKCDEMIENLINNFPRYLNKIQEQTGVQPEQAIKKIIIKLINSENGILITTKVKKR